MRYSCRGLNLNYQNKACGVKYTGTNQKYVCVYMYVYVHIYIYICLYLYYIMCLCKYNIGIHLKIYKLNR